MKKLFCIWSNTLNEYPMVKCVSRKEARIIKRTKEIKIITNDCNEKLFTPKRISIVKELWNYRKEQG